MRISAKADYAVRAAIELAVAGTERPTKGDSVAQAQGIPLKFLENILADMRHAGLVTSRRGAEGGYWLARPAEEITVADIIRAVEGPLASVRGGRPEDVDYAGTAEPLQRVWIARAREPAPRRRERHARRPRLGQAAQGRRGAGEGPRGLGRRAAKPRSAARFTPSRRT